MSRRKSATPVRTKESSWTARMIAAIILVGSCGFAFFSAEAQEQQALLHILNAEWEQQKLRSMGSDAVLPSASLPPSSDSVVSTQPVQSSTTIPNVSASLEQHKKSLVYMGNKATNTGWYIDTLCLENKNNLVVYGVGAGEDISWDTGLIDRYPRTAHVYLFDPTDKSIRYTTPIVARYATSHPGQLTHTPEGLSNEKGSLTFALPANPDHVSMRQADLATADMQRKVTIPVNTLPNWMEKFGHTYLDILKIDIEGSEYGVLEALLEANFLPFTQLLVEYHVRFLSPSERTRHDKLLHALKSAGFVELWSANGGQEVGYLKVSDLAYCTDGTSSRQVGRGLKKI